MLKVIIFQTTKCYLYFEPSNIVVTWKGPKYTSVEFRGDIYRGEMRCSARSIWVFNDQKLYFPSVSPRTLTIPSPRLRKKVFDFKTEIPIQLHIIPLNTTENVISQKIILIPLMEEYQNSTQHVQKIYMNYDNSEIRKKKDCCVHETF